VNILLTGGAFPIAINIFYTLLSTEPPYTDPFTVEGETLARTFKGMQNWWCSEGNDVKPPADAQRATIHQKMRDAAPPHPSHCVISRFIYKPPRRGPPTEPRSREAA